MTVGASGLAVRNLSRETFGAGGTIAAFIVAPRVGEVRVGARETSGAGGMMLVVRRLLVRLVVGEGDEFNSGQRGPPPIFIPRRIGARKKHQQPYTAPRP